MEGFEIARFYYSKGGLKPSRNVYKLIAVLVIVIGIPLLIILGVILFSPQLIQDVRIRTIIDRTADTEAEWNALRTAELTNFSEYFRIPPFETTDGDSYIPDIQWETWFHYVNNLTLEHYINRTFYGTKYHLQLHITLNYTARAHFMLDFSVSLSSEKIQVYNAGKTITFSLRRYIDSYESRWTQWFNGSYTHGTTEGIPQGIEAHYGDGYFLYMGLEHGEWWSPIGAFGPQVDQYIIMNTTYQILYAVAVEGPHIVAISPHTDPIQDPFDNTQILQKSKSGMVRNETLTETIACMDYFSKFWITCTVSPR